MWSSGQVQHSTKCSLCTCAITASPPCYLLEHDAENGLVLTKDCNFLWSMSCLIMSMKIFANNFMISESDHRCLFRALSFTVVVAIGYVSNSLTTKKQTTIFSSANFQKMLSPSYIILRIQRVEGKQCRSR